MYNRRDIVCANGIVMRLCNRRHIAGVDEICEVNTVDDSVYELEKQ